MAMAVTVKALQDGPLMVDGECQVIDAQGNTLPSKGDKTYLCRCGSSANKPYCDGAHKKVDFKS
jgi:CDGSH-type Zn-finger protein